MTTRFRLRLVGAKVQREERTEVMATKPMNCKDFQRQDAFDRYVLGHMADDELARFEEHLLLCKSCMYQVEQSDAFAGTFRSAIETEQRKADIRLREIDLEILKLKERLK